MKRASLVKAGNALAPDAFAMVLESENESKDTSHGKQPSTLLSKLAARAEQFEKAVSKAIGHRKRLGAQNDQERCAVQVLDHLRQHSEIGPNFLASN